MSESSFFKDLGGEIVDRATSIASIGLAGFVLLFSALGLAGFQPVEAGNSVLASVSLHPAVLGEQDYQMKVVFRGSALDLAVTPYSYDPISAKWNYKISWNRKNGPVGNININGNLFYQGAYGIGEAYTGFNLNANSTYTLSYTYESGDGRAVVTKIVFKGTFKTIDGTGNVTSSTSIPGNTPNNTVSQNTSRVGNVPSYGYNTPAYGYFNLASPTSGQTVDSGFLVAASSLNPDGVQSSYAVVISNKSGATVKTFYSSMQSISNNNQSFSISYWIDTSSYANDDYVASIFVLNLKGTLYLAGTTPIVSVKHNTIAPSYGYMNISVPISNTVVTGDGPLTVNAVGRSAIAFNGDFQIYIDSKLVVSGGGVTSEGGKVISVNAEVRNLASVYYTTISQGLHTLEVRAKLLDQTLVTGSTQFTYAIPSPTSQLPSFLNKQNFAVFTQNVEQGQKNAVVYTSKLTILCDSNNPFKFNSFRLIAPNATNGNNPTAARVYIDNTLIKDNLVLRKIMSPEDSLFWELGQTMSFQPCTTHTLEIRADILPSQQLGDFPVTITKLALYNVGSTPTYFTPSDGNIVTITTTVNAPTPAFVMDKTDYKVGDSAYYGVQNAAPNQTIYWSSSKNGVSTGEVCSSYGQTTNSAGTWTGYGNPWTSNDVGTWNKILYVGSCTGTAYSKTFTVK